VRLPFGLLSDGPGESLYSYLLGRVLSRSVAHDGAGASVDAETLSHVLHLEASAPARHWGQALQLSAEWFQLRGVDPTVLEQERSLVLETSPALAAEGGLLTFGTAAWNQVVRHGRSDARVLRDVAGVTPESLLAFANARLRVGEGVQLAVCGPAALEVVREAIQFELGDLSSLPPETPRCTVDPASLLEPRDLHATWDLPVGLYLEWYALPSASPEERAMGHVLVRELMQRVLAAGMERGVPCRVSPLQAPEGRWVALSAVVQDAAEVPGLTAQFREELDRLLERQPGTLGVEMALVQAALENRSPLDLTALRNSHPPQLRHDALEGDALRRVLSLEYEMGAPREELAVVFRSVARPQLEEYVRTVFSAERRSTLFLSPGSHD
jgi:hypothetical protein